MKISFGILTYPGNEEEAKKVIKSIERQNITLYEIIVIGGSNVYKNNNLIHIEFDESIKKGWITKKRNIFFKEAKYEILVCMHDYLTFDTDWYKGLLRYGANFDVLSNRILKKNGERHYDWNLSRHNRNRFDKHILNTNQKLLPYDIAHLSKYMYISGAFFILKKHVANKYKFNESLLWQQAEDVEWSHRVRKEYVFKFNPYSKIEIDSSFKDFYMKNVASDSLINSITNFDNSKFSKKIDFLIYTLYKEYFISLIKNPMKFLKRVQNKFKIKLFL